jgi:hypothetical protein
MTCSRCQGLMIEDQFLDMQSQYGQMWARSLRCVNCGHIHDATIEQHRLARQEQAMALRMESPIIRMMKSILEDKSIIERAA